MTDSKDLPATKRAYTYCTKTRELLGELDAYLSPLDGTYPLPANATFAEPGAKPGPQKSNRLLADGSAWEVAEDFRYIGLWDTASVAQVPNTMVLGDKLPTGVTSIAPTTYQQQDRKASAWNASTNTWDAAPDYRGFHYWTTDGQERVIADVGEAPPAGYLTAPPELHAETELVDATPA